MAKKEYDNTPVVSQRPPGSLLEELGYKNPDGTMKEPVSKEVEDILHRARVKTMDATFRVGSRAWDWPGFGLGRRAK